MEQRTYRAVCFDLDGTLLPLDMDEFMKRYFGTLGPVVMAHGITAEAFGAGMNAGIKAMAAHDDGARNSDVFWAAFFEYVDRDAADWSEVFTDFYANRFGAIGEGMPVNPAAARAIETLSQKGYPLALTTMPMFPLRAVQWRVSWAGVDPDAFARITTFDNSTSVKPKLSYFAENLAALGVEGRDVLMVGNNTVEDLSFRALGADAFLVTDCLLNPDGMDVDTVRHGSLARFAEWVEGLPACEDPARDVCTGLVDPAARDAVLARHLSAEELAADNAAGTDHFKVYGR